MDNTHEVIQGLIRHFTHTSCVSSSDPSSKQRATPTQPKTYLVGVGPGDPSLLTLRAIKAIASGNVFLYDRLISPAILALLPKTCESKDRENIYVGKHAFHTSIRQPSINALMIKLVKQGKTVVRLKGGDPFIFGRGGEEIETFMRAHIPFEIVPGITAASGVSAYAGIPLTHRDFAHSCLFSTARLQHGRVDLDWIALTRPHQTVVLYMGLTALDQVCTQLIAHGMLADTPAAIVQHATLPTQKTVIATVGTLPQQTKISKLQAPTTVIIGHVVRLQAQFSWEQS